VSPTTTSPHTLDTQTLDTQIDWVVTVLNGAPTDETEVADRFSPVLLQYVPADGFLDVVSQLRSDVSESWEMVGRDEVANGAEVGLGTSSGDWVMAISIDEVGRIETLLLQPKPSEITDPPETLDDLADRLGELGRVSMQVSEVTTGTCMPEFAVADDVVRPIGSTFKLYVLGALADAVARGDIAWDDELEIRDDLKSLPSGTFQTRPAGSTATVLEFAEAMISASDNTATDHLIDLVGRDAVESALTEFGNAHADRNRPFLATREFFALKVAAPDDVVASWRTGSEAERRELLAGPIGELEATIADATTWVAPVLIDEIEWFGDATDQCRAFVGLVDRANVPGLEELTGILSLNPGVAYDPLNWSLVAYKGGSEPGVLNLAWYLASPDGRAYTYVVNVNDPDARLDEAEVIALAAIGLDLIPP
jgi:beta-lactamase class A